MESKQQAAWLAGTAISEPRPSSLRAVLGALGSFAPTVSIAPRGLDVTVAGPTIFDRCRPEAVSDRIVLAVSVDASGLEAVALIDAAGRAGAAAIVFLSTSSLRPRAHEVATQAGVAVLLAPTGVSWDTLHAQLRAAVDATSVPSSLEADLSSLADTLYRVLGGPVVIVDTALTVLAHSALDDSRVADELQRSVILARRFPLDWSRSLQRDGTLSRLRSTDEPLLVDGPAGCKERLAASIRIGGEAAGSIWVQRANLGFDCDAPRRLAAFARAAAPLVLAEQWRSTAAYDDRSQLLLELILGRLPVEPLATALNIDPSTLATAAAISVTSRPGRDVLSADLAAKRAMSEIALYCKSLRSSAVVTRVGAVGYLLMPHAPASNGNNDVGRLLRSLVKQVKSALGHTVIAAIGGSAKLKDIRAAFLTADRVMRLALSDQSPRSVVTEGDVRTRLAVDRLTELCGTDPQLRSPSLAVLAQHDRDHGTDYVMTLRAYLDHFGDASRAATNLGVHPNTVRYRLKRAEVIAGLCLDDPDERFIYELGFRLRDAEESLTNA